jgi:hypothetical protein
MGGEPASPGVGLVDDVVVHEGGGMNELDDRRIEDGAVARVPAEPRRHQEHGGPDALSAAHLNVAAHLWNQLDARLEMSDEFGFNAQQLAADRLEDPGEIGNRSVRGVRRERFRRRTHR